MEALGFGALACVVVVVGANATPSSIDCAAADATSPSRIQTAVLRPAILQGMIGSATDQNRVICLSNKVRLHDALCWKLHLVQPKPVP